MTPEECDRETAQTILESVDHLSSPTQIREVLLMKFTEALSTARREGEAEGAKYVEVVAAVIEQDRKVWVFKRGGNDSYSGRWEFPGGKIENGESPESGMRREMLEEFGVDAVVGPELDHYWYRYPGRDPISLRFFSVQLLAEPSLLEHSERCLVNPTELAALDLLNGDMKFVATRYLKEAEAAVLREALELMPYAVPQDRVEVMRQKDPLYTGHDPLYGDAPKWYPVSVLVDAENLVRIREALFSTTAGASLLQRLDEADSDCDNRDRTIATLFEERDAALKRLEDAERRVKYLEEELKQLAALCRKEDPPEVVELGS